jgi:hypothetical protein
MTKLDTRDDAPMAIIVSIVEQMPDKRVVRANRVLGDAESWPTLRRTSIK